MMRVSVDSKGNQLYYIHMYPPSPKLPSIFFFFNVDHYYFLKILLNWYIIASVFHFSFLATRHVGSSLPDQGSNPPSVSWKVMS